MSIETLNDQITDKDELKDAIEVCKDKHDSNNVISYNNWLLTLKLKIISYNSVHCWMSKLRYVYDEHKK